MLHESGEFLTDRMRIAPKSETNPQDQGSAISYARRYSLQSMVFIPAEDDDGNKAASASKTVVKPATETQASPTEVVGKCTLCGAVGQYHKPGCPNKV